MVVTMVSYVEQSARKGLGKPFFFLSEELNAQVSWKFRILREIVIYTQDLRDTGE